MVLKKKAKKPFIPVERRGTVRQNIISVIKGRTLLAREISAEVKVSEKEVYGHLEHIQKTINKKKLTLLITPAGCRKGGFVFKKRDRLNKPGKCPVCNSELIQEPLFSIKGGGA